MKKINLEEAIKRFSGRDDIKLVDYKGWTKKSKFYDKKNKQYFFSIPSSVFQQKSSSLKSSGKEKITFDMAQFRFSDRSDIKLVDYKGWTKKSKFYDEVVKQHWWTVPKNVFKNKSAHPKRRYSKQKETNLHKYGFENPFMSSEIKTKIKNTNVKKYGVKNVLQSKNIRSKIETTNLEKYGTKNPMQNKTIQQKAKQTNLEKYGIENPAKSNVIKNKTKQTNIKKYGVEHWVQTDCFKSSLRERKTKYFIKDRKENLFLWVKGRPELEISYTKLQKFCLKTKQSIILEKDLLCWINNHINNKTNIETYTENLFETKHYNKKPKTISKPYRPDFKLSPNVFLNVDGLYWHSELRKDEWHHYNLRKEFEDNGLRIFQFYENEIFDKPDIIKSIINNSLGKIKNKIFARKCQVKTVEQNEAKLFLNDNHLMGSIPAKHLGLYYNNQLISILSYKQIKHVCKIERFCSLLQCVVAGGFSKLLKHLEQNILKPNTTEIHNWVDLRYGVGKQLVNKKFILSKDTLGWKWTDGKSTFNRLKCRANMDERGLSQQEHANELGWYKIYDAGQRLYVKHI